MGNQKKNFIAHGPERVCSVIDHSKISKNPMFVILKNWKNIVGELLNKVSSPVQLNSGTLIIAVKNHSWMQELMFSKSALKEKLLELTDAVSDIKFIIAQSEHGAKHAKKSAPKKQYPYTREDENFINSVVNNLKSEELKLSIYKSFVKQKQNI
jgi:hypothetical protein